MRVLCFIGCEVTAEFDVTTFKISALTNSSSADQQQGEMAAVESGGGFSQKRNTNSQVGICACQTDAH